MKKYVPAIVLGVAGVVTAVAQIFAGQQTASWLIFHQEETPNCLK